VSRKNPDGKERVLVHFWLKQENIEAIAKLAEAP
jgi:hypothetical protein